MDKMNKYVNEFSDGTCMIISPLEDGFGIYKIYNKKAGIAISMYITMKDAINWMEWINNHFNELNYNQLLMSNGDLKMGYTEFTNLPRLELHHKQDGIENTIGVLLCRNDLVKIMDFFKLQIK